MRARIIKMNYIQGRSDSYIEQGYKRGQHPRGGIYYGGGGTYRVIYCTPADIEVFGIDDNDRRLTG